jgi:enoyl-CoA hydratase/carnithine racemase
VTEDERLVLRDDLDGVATLTLNRPDKLNALNPAAFVELRSHIDTLATQTDSVGCVVLTGAGRSFCAGNDLAAISAREQAPSPHFQAETVDALEALPQPVIGKVKGHCFTGGLELALGCDLIVAGESASFSDTHGKWGMAPVWGMSVRLPERIGRAAAKELMFTGRRVDGREAERIGLAVRCVPDDDLDATVAEMAAAIVANSWGTSRIDKLLLAASARMPRDEALPHERSAPYGFPDDLAERLAGGA